MDYRYHIKSLFASTGESLSWKEIVDHGRGLTTKDIKELRSELSSLGYEFKSEGDTEVLLAAWSIWREECLNKLLGMFAFIILDNKSKTLILVRDRFGVKPLYKMIKKDFMK